MLGKYVNCFLLALAMTGVVNTFGETGSPALDTKLKALEEQVGEADAREVEFLEKRYFPFRNKPVELVGVLRMLVGHGVSIEYPEKRTAIVADEEGVLLRKFSKDGSFQQKNAGKGESNTIDLLKAAFEFNSAALSENFDMAWSESNESWSIVMTPREEEKIESVTISGIDLTVESIVMAFKGDRRIEIFPKKEATKAKFSDEEFDMYFRDRPE